MLAGFGGGNVQESVTAWKLLRRRKDSTKLYLRIRTDVRGVG